MLPITCILNNTLCPPVSTEIILQKPLKSNTESFNGVKKTCANYSMLPAVDTCMSYSSNCQ